MNITDTNKNFNIKHNKNLNTNKVLVGMSGGVDSSVAAYLLKKQGFEVYGACIKIHQSASEIEDALCVCEKLGIECYELDASKEFDDIVINDFVSQYKVGCTPNPCVICNKYIKWKYLLEKADEIGAYYIATGHYAKVTDGHIVPADIKDQSYALYMLSEDDISRTLLPLGDYSKEEVRAFASKSDLPTASKSESMDICFVPDGNYADYVDASSKPGDFVDKDGHILGRHKGIVNYTVGQRKGLGIAASKPLYVLSINVADNLVVLGTKEDTYVSEVFAKDVFFTNNAIKEEALKKEIEVIAKIRYNHRGERATLFFNEDFARISFEQPVSSPAPGQSVVFYKDGTLIGGGIMEMYPRG